MRFPSINQYKNQIKMLQMQYDHLLYFQQQAETGKKILHGSDDPMLADRIKSIQNHLSQLGHFDNNLSLATNRQSQKEAAADRALDLTARVQEIIQKAKNGTLSDSDRSSLAKELEGILNQYDEIANSQDANSEYIFSGLNIHNPAFRNENGHFIYQGTAMGADIAIGLGLKVAYSESGEAIFVAIPTGNGTFTTKADASNTGTGIIGGGKVISYSDYIFDDYTISFVTNSSGNLAYQVTGVNGGQIIPAPPATVPDDAPDYLADTDIVFNGVSVEITGEPNPGDSFIIVPSTKRSVFDNMTQLIDLLNQPTGTAQEKARLKQGLGELQENFEQVYQNFISFLQNVGNQGIIIDHQKNLSEALQLDGQAFLKELSEADYGEVISNITQQNLALQLTQKIYLQIQETRRLMLMGN
ncbi:flagellar hook-associated protein 3 [Legionella israelensis]|uniref:flagellar hook-associated protein FlgL n=1 Tax=Legionella israelensis TaxID=454 RepID=UPI00117D9C85|nr:flagellar hook-associated protein FlgL [Legionella israelensis]QDP73438.1 flagellar hook-associated protein 3 [Legionella israelensis]